MMEKSGFFNARKQPDGKYDRTYLAEEFAAYFSKFIGNGVYPNPSTGLQVLENDTPDMTVNMQTGYAFINGYTYYNEGIKAFNIDVADGLLNRKDAIFVRWDKVNRQITSVYVKGELSSDPVAPNPIRTADIWDLNPCIINVKAGATKITQADIEDTRMNKSLCGIVSALIEQIDTTTLYLQVQKDLENFQDVTYQEFETWFNEIKDKLGDDPATALQQQITNIMDGTDVPNSGVSVYVHSKSGTVHEFTGAGPNGRALMTANVEVGDTFTVNGSPVTAYVGAEDAVSSMAGSAWNGKWVTFVFENSAINFKGGGGLPAADKAKLIPENIKYGVTLFDGTPKEIVGSFTDDGNASAINIIKGAVAYSKGERIDGSLPQYTGAQVITPKTANQQIITPPVYVDKVLTVAGDPNLVAGNIRQGVSIFGVAGIYFGSKIVYFGCGNARYNETAQSIPRAWFDEYFTASGNSAVCKKAGTYTVYLGGGAASARRYNLYLNGSQIQYDGFGNYQDFWVTSRTLNVGDTLYVTAWHPDATTTALLVIAIP